MHPRCHRPRVSHQPPRPEREAILAALNGVLGDHLATTDNPLAITMQFRHSGRPLLLERHALRSRLAGATPQLMVLLHGLCMNDLQWHRAGHDHGEVLAREVMIGHSMGGLVARSAIHHGAQMQRGGLRWPGRVNDLVCLGTSHQGAPLERAGHGVDLLLGAAPYAAPLARLGKMRSAGINDLRLGNILKRPAGDDGTQRADPVSLPGGVSCYAIAASLGPASGGMKSRLLGDGLVPVASALGQHDEPDLSLGFAPERQAVVHGTGHLDLLSSAEVYGLLRQWLG